MATYEYAIDAAVSVLAKHINEDISQFKHVSREWPNPSYELDPPELSIISSNHNITIARPYELSSEKIALGTNYRFKFLMGYVDFQLQLDVWTDNKEERQDLVQKLWQLFNPEPERAGGLTLSMDDYHDRNCRFEFDETTLNDTEDSATRSEWRYTLNLRCHTDMVIEKIAPTMQDIDLTTEINDAEERVFVIRGAEYQASNYNADTVPIISGATTKTVRFKNPMPNATYGIRAVLLNDNDAAPQVQETVITALDENGFTALWSGPTDSNNYVLAYVAQAVDGVADKQGQTALADGVDSASIVIPTLGGTFAVTPQLINIVDASPQIIPLIVTAKTLSSFDVLFSGPMDSANYKLGWLASEIDSKFGEQSVEDLVSAVAVSKINFARFTRNFGIALAFENTVDAAPQIHMGTVTLKSDVGVDVESQQPDTSNYKVNYILRES